jgi:hypothetical protein
MVDHWHWWQVAPVIAGFVYVKVWGCLEIHHSTSIVTFTCLTLNTETHGYRAKGSCKMTAYVTCGLL